MISPLADEAIVRISQIVPLPSPFFFLLLPFLPPRELLSFFSMFFRNECVLNLRPPQDPPRYLTPWTNLDTVSWTPFYIRPLLDWITPGVQDFNFYSLLCAGNRKTRACFQLWPSNEYTGWTMISWMAMNELYLILFFFLKHFLYNLLWYTLILFFYSYLKRNKFYGSSQIVEIL